MKLKELFEGLYDGVLIAPFDDCDIAHISCDSRDINAQSLFFAMKGIDHDGNEYIGQAISKGARIIVSEEQTPPAEQSRGAYFIQVDDCKDFLKKVSGRFYDYPSNRIKVVGITGTNGKTTVAYLIESVLNAARLKCAVTGTINHRIGGEVRKSNNTTPGFLDNQKFLFECVQKKMDYCLMEVSSHGLDQGRVDDIDFKAGIYTNLTRDHLDYHTDEEEYFQAKAKLFTGLKADAQAIINKDAAYADQLVSLTKSPTMTYGIEQESDVMAKDVLLSLDGTEFMILASGNEFKIRTKLIGTHNVYNILAAAALCLSENISIELIMEGIQQAQVIPGRLESVNYGQNFHVFLDYAHTPDALENVLTSIKDVSSRKLILIFGCGGDRDKKKRPQMGRIATEFADQVYVTSDNPRSEEPKLIIDQIVKGCKGSSYEVIADRKKAIKQALVHAQEGDIVLCAGKGHEDYQTVKGKNLSFDEKKIIRDIVNANG